MATRKKQEAEINPKDDMINRSYVIYGLFIVATLLIIGLLIWIATGNDNVEKHIKLMNKNIINVEHPEAHRGAILTCDGEPLALSSRRYEPVMDFKSEGMDPKHYERRSKDPQKIFDELRALANNMALFFNKSDAENHGYKYRSADEYYELFMQYHRATKLNREVRIFPRAVVLDEWNMIRKEFPVINHSLGGVYKTDDYYVRVYPYGDLARQIVGVCRSQKDITSYKTTVVDAMGNVRDTILQRDTMIRITSSIENLYDSLLAGQNGTYVEQRIANGFWTHIDDPRNSKPIDGHNIVTTINGELQQMATESLRNQLEAQRGSYGVAMVMETATGNMLCLVNLSAGKSRGQNYSEQIYNHAMKTRTAPGSTFKLVSTMALLEIGGATLNSRENVPSRVDTIGRRRIRDEHTMRDKDGKQITQPTLIEGFAHSSNLYYANAIYRRFKKDPSKYTTYLDGLLFNSHIGLEELGAKKGIVHHPGSTVWKKNGGTDWVLPQMPYGYFVEVTPLQTMTFYNGVANGGKMVAPRFVDRIEFNGRVTEVMPTNVLLERMCSERTQRDLMKCLEAGAAPERTSRRFVDLPVNIGCKTGTAQLWGEFTTVCEDDKQSFKAGFRDENGNVKFYLGSLVAVMPIEKPKYTIMVAIAKEKTGAQDAYYGAALAGGVVRDIADYLYTNDLGLHPTVEIGDNIYRPTMIKRGRSSSVTQVAETFCNITQSGDFESDWCQANITNGQASIEPMRVSSGTVPNVLDMGLVDAIYLMEQQGMIVTHSGMGRVTKQSISPGTKITNRTRKIHLTLSM